MGAVKVSILAENAADRILFETGHLEENKIRRMEIIMLVDTGAVLNLLPQDAVEELGLKSLGKVVVTYADDRKEELQKAGPLNISAGNRTAHTVCLVGPPTCEPLLGQTVLEELDLLVDSVQQKLVPRPESPYLPMVTLKRM